MLALKSKLTMTLLMAATFMMVSGNVFGQQTPAQRYQPARDGSFGNAPPSVHVPPQQMQRLASPTFRATGANDPATSTGLQPRPSSTSFTFSDATQRGSTSSQSRTSDLRSPTRPGFEQSPSYGTSNGQIQQTSFEVVQNGEPSVPEILSGNSQPGQADSGQASGSRLPASESSRFLPSNDGASTVEEFPRKTPADFESQMNQARSGLPRIAPGELASQQEDISAQMAEVRRRAEERARQQAALAAEMQAPPIDTAPATFGQQEALRQTAANTVSYQASVDPALETDAANETPAASESEDEISASDFIGRIAANNQVSAAPGAPIQDPNTAPKLVARQSADFEQVPAVMQLASAQESLHREPVQDTEVQPVSSEIDDPNAKIRLAAPAIEVETFGPQSIGINKPANYQVIVHNRSSAKAERILVGINMPAWVDIENVNLTTGGKELTDGQNQARLVWSIDQIPGNASQTITVTAVPRKAELFDVGVEWTLVPRVGKAAITVTEPKLEMNISGPLEVLYGETALYHVTVRNPGTGDAENVIVMLPEALGGERQSLGNIDAGKEKNFQVELLARTAGDLNLFVTAAGDGNLKTSAERALIVRRAILGISLEGPGLKYAGSVAQYIIQITNTGDAPAAEVVTAVALPPGVKYLGGIDAVKLIEGGMRWPVGSLDPGQTRKYTINCQLDTSGDLQLEVGARGKGDLAASSACLTTVETVADLVLSVADPKGPLPTGEEIPYQIKVQNRGSKSAKGVNLVMQFSEGIEPKSASGLEHQIVPGQVLFSPIQEIAPGQEVTFKVTALAMKSGTHIFRAQLTCQDSDSREIAEGTTRFFGESIQPTATANAAGDSNDFRADPGTEFKR